MLEHHFLTTGFVYIVLKQIEDLFAFISKHFIQIVTARQNLYVHFEGVQPLKDIRKHTDILSSKK